MARERVRALVLCEDQQHRSFLIRLCERLGIAPVRFSVAPVGDGSAEQWVREQLPRHADAFRAQAKHQPNLGLLVMTDGDRLGLSARKASLDAKLVAVGKGARGTSERIAYLAPTWSIETWLIWLSGTSPSFPGFGEGVAYKDDAEYRKLAGAGMISTKLAASRWTPAIASENAITPSLTDARVELTRIL